MRDQADVSEQAAEELLRHMAKRNLLGAEVKRLKAETLKEEVEANSSSERESGMPQRKRQRGCHEGNRQ